MSKDMAELTSRLAITAIEQNELYQAAKRDAEKAEAYAASLDSDLTALTDMLRASKQRNDALEAKLDLADAIISEGADRIEELEAERDAALVALFECMEEIDAYIQQEYPQDHPVHERYRQRDYSANPARIFLRDRPDALVKARVMLAEADLKRQTATMEGRGDE